MKERAFYLDAVKGIAILCITFLHFEAGVIPNWLNTWIGLFMITTFYFTSGWVSGIQNKRITSKELFKKRIKQLGIPYLWFSVGIIIFDIMWVFLGFMDIQILARDIYKTITLRGIGTLWFLPVLFIGEMIFCTIRNCKHKREMAVAGVILTLIVSYLYYDIWGKYYNLSVVNKLIDAPIQPIAKGIMSWPIIAIGYIFTKYVWNRTKKLQPYYNMLIGIVLLLLSIIMVVSPPFNIFYINGLLCNILPSIAFILIFAVIGYNNIISRFFIFWGVNSLILMCTHFSIFLEIFKVVDAKIIHSNFCGYTTIIYFILTIIFTYPLVALFNGKLRFIIGKN